MVAIIGTAILGSAFAGTTAATVVGGVVTAGAVAGVAGTVEAGRAASKSARLQQRAQELQQKRQRRAAIRSNMIASSRAKASAQASGVAQSSGLQGAVGSGRSQLGSELGFGTQMSGLSGQITELGIKEQKASQIASLGFSAMKFGMSAQGQGMAKNMFGPVDRTLPAGVSPTSSLSPASNPFYG
jgi:hypothetical protein